jgi:hypothetical protein
MCRLPWYAQNPNYHSDDTWSPPAQELTCSHWSRPTLSEASFETLSDHQAINGYSDLSTRPPYLYHLVSGWLSTQLPDQTNFCHLQASSRSLFQSIALPDVIYPSHLHHVGIIFPVRSSYCLMLKPPRPVDLLHWGRSFRSADQPPHRIFQPFQRVHTASHGFGGNDKTTVPILGDAAVIHPSYKQRWTLEAMTIR